MILNSAHPVLSSGLGNGSKWGQVSCFSVSQCGLKQVNHRDLEPFSCGPQKPCRSPHSVVSECVLSEASNMLDGQISWMKLNNEVCSSPSKRPASQTHTNKNKNYCNNGQLAFHWQTAVVHFSPSSSVTCPLIWNRNVVPIPSIMKTYILVWVISNIHNYPGCNSMIDRKLNRSLTHCVIYYSSPASQTNW